MFWLSCHSGSWTPHQRNEILNILCDFLAEMKWSGWSQLTYRPPTSSDWKPMTSKIVRDSLVVMVLGSGFETPTWSPK